MQVDNTYIHILKVLGYTETKSICEDVCVLSAAGTAALVDESLFSPEPHDAVADSLLLNANNAAPLGGGGGGGDLLHSGVGGGGTVGGGASMCKLCHVTYGNDNELPFPVALSVCNVCGLAQVPDVIFTSIQPLSEVETVGQGCLVRSIVTRPRKKCSGEISAKIISDYLPFMVSKYIIYQENCQINRG